MQKKRSFVILLLAVLFNCSYAQNDESSVLSKPIYVVFNKISVCHFIDTLQHITQIPFSYDVNALPIDSIISVDSDNLTLKSLLYQVLGADKVDVSALMGQVVISRGRQLPIPARPRIVLRGKVVSDENADPLDASTLSLNNEPIGTITNAEGEFVLNLPDVYEGRIINVSHVGYLNTSLAFPKSDSLIIISLKSATIQLPEVKVVAILADKIVGEMVNKRDDNYLNSQVLLSGFYRETIKEDEDYVQVSEAVIEISKPSYRNLYQLERVRFVKGRMTESSQKMSRIQFRLQGGPYYFSRLDVARTLDFLPQTNNSILYKYSYEGADYQYGRLVYKIGFEPVYDNGDLLYKGELRIDAETFALVAVSFEMTDKTLRESRKYLIKKESPRYRSKPFYARYYLDYRPFKDKWILNRVRGEIKVRIIDKDNKVNSVFQAVSELLISDLQAIDFDKIKNNEAYKPDYILADQITEIDDAFWNNFNIIKPEEDLINVFKPAK